MLRFEDHERHIRTILSAALEAVEPARCVRKSIQARPLRGENRAVVAIGKAAPAMYRGYTEACGKVVRRFMLTTEGGPAPAWARVGDHPIPRQRSAKHAAALIEFLKETDADSVVVLLSGGASSLLCSPAPDLSVGEVADISLRMMLAGASIYELNTVRTHLETLKGGGAAGLTDDRPIDLLVLSDVTGSDLSVIGSGPWWPCDTHPQDAVDVLARLDVQISHNALTALQQSSRRYRLTEPAGVDPRIVGDNRSALLAACEAARNLGFFPVEEGIPLDGPAGGLGCAIVQGVAHKHAGCWVSGGESTVNVGAGSGKGGRNQELALAAAIEVEGRDGIAITTFATDGVDGPTDAAGAIVIGKTCERARQMDIDPRASLARHDSYNFFSRVGGHLKPGPTGTNVCDLALVLVY